MTVYKHKNGYYCYNFMYKGKRYCRSFKGLSKDKVIELEIRAKNEILEKGHGLTKRKIYRLSKLIDDFKEYRKVHYTRPDEFDYVIDKFFKLVGDKEADEITVSDIERYARSRIDLIKNSSINREIDVIKRIFSLAVENKYISFNPCSTMKKLRIENPPERYLTKDEEEKLLAVCNPIMKAIIVTALHTGMRQNEILSLKWQDVFFEENYLIALNTKNNKPRKLPLSNKLKVILFSLPKLSEYVFTSPITGSRYKEIKSTFARAVKRAGIPHISFHKLRHTTASRLNEEGVDIVTIQRILDHADLKTTQRYTHNSSDSIANAIEKLDKY